MKRFLQCSFEPVYYTEKFRKGNVEYKHLRNPSKGAKSGIRLIDGWAVDIPLFRVEKNIVRTMSLRTQVEGLNKLLTAVYGRDTRLSTLLLDLGFSPQQIEILRRQHAQQIVESYIALLKERIVADSDGERLYEIIKHRFGLDGEQPQTLQSLGEKFGISRERARQLEQKALKRCRIRSRLKSWEVGLYDIAYSLLDASDASVLREWQCKAEHRRIQAHWRGNPQGGQ